MDKRITLLFNVSEPLALSVSVVKIANRTATVTTVDQKQYSATIVIQIADIEGTAQFSILYADRGGNFGSVVTTTTDASAIIVGSCLVLVLCYLCTFT